MYEEDYIPTTTTQDPDYFDVFSMMGKRSAPSFTNEDAETKPFADHYIDYPNLTKISTPSFMVRLLLYLF